MMPLIARLVVEIILGFCVAGVLLAIIVPLLTWAGWIRTGDATGALVIGGTIVATIAMMVFRPGSALNRRDR